MPSIMTKAQLEAYHRDGFVIVPGMFDRAEVDLLLAPDRTAKDTAGPPDDLAVNGLRRGHDRL